MNMAARECILNTHTRDMVDGVLCNVSAEFGLTPLESCMNDAFCNEPIVLSMRDSPRYATQYRCVVAMMALSAHHLAKQSCGVVLLG